MNIDDLLADGNWEEAFNVAMPPRATEGYHGDLASFSRSDVEEILAAAEGENDGDSWIGAFRLKDGRYAKITAWCDYTGWGCQDGGDCEVAATYEDLIRWGMTIEERQRLHLDA